MPTLKKLLIVCKIAYLQEPFTERITPVRLVNTKGGRETSPFVTLNVLAESRMLVMGCADGNIKICT